MLRQFIRDNLFSVDRRSGREPSNRRDCLLVTDVAPVSIAAEAGIAKGDLLLDVDGKPASRIEFDEFIDVKARHRYRFYRPDGGDELIVVASGAPLGLELKESTESIVSRIRAGEGEEDWSDLISLWVREDWPALEAAVKAEFKPAGRFGSLFRKTEDPETPALVMLGAARYEQGDRAAGLKMIRQYYERFERGYVAPFQAIARFYLGLAAREEGDVAGALDLFAEAYGFFEADRIGDELPSEVPETPAQDELIIVDDDPVDERFPLLYVLPRVDSDETVSLKRTLARMKSHQILIVCVLSSYRANGPYHNLMIRHIRWARHFHDFIADLHVITEAHRPGPDDSPAERDFVETWLQGEKRARGLGVPFAVLYDGEGIVDAEVDAEMSPHFMVFDRQGYVLSEEEYTEVEFWNLLAGLHPS